MLLFDCWQYLEVFCCIDFDFEFAYLPVYCFEFVYELGSPICEPALWSPSYFAASCGGAPLSIIAQYIKDQRSPSF